MRVVIALLLACAAVGARAQDIVPQVALPGTEAGRALSTDRPDKTESPYTVPAGRFQIELDFATYTTTRDAGVRTKTLNVAPFNLKYGLDERTDVQFIFDSYLRQTATDRAAATRSRARVEKVDGVGDITVRLKRNLWGNDGGDTALALMPFVKLPTNSDDLGNDTVEFGLIVPLAVRLSDRVGLGLMTEVDMLQQAAGRGYAPTFVNSATVAFALTDRLGLYTELFTQRATERGSAWVVTGDTGLTYALSDEMQLDTGVNLGLTDAADDVNLFVGLSRRF